MGGGRQHGQRQRHGDVSERAEARGRLLWHGLVWTIRPVANADASPATYAVRPFCLLTAAATAAAAAAAAAAAVDVRWPSLLLLLMFLGHRCEISALL